MDAMRFGYRYARWDGTQRVFDIDEEALMDQLSDELDTHGTLQRALRELLQRGVSNRWGDRIPGLRDLMERLRQRRQQSLKQHNLDSLMDDLKDRLNKVVETEHQGIQRRLDEARQQVEQAQGEEHAAREKLMDLLQQRAQRNLQALDNLPPNFGGALRQLQEYDFMDPEAQRLFKELMDTLRRHMLQSIAQDMKERIASLTPEQMAALREMLRDLNSMLRDRMEGKEPDFQRFMERWGPMFGPNPPQSLDELMQLLQQQMAQAQSLMESLSPEQRQELQEALNAALDPETARELAEMAWNMEQLLPVQDLLRRYPFLGKEETTLEQAMELMEQLQALDQLEQRLKEAARQGTVDDVDPNAVQELLGEDARRDLERLQRLARELEEAGYLTRKGDKLVLTPKGIRRIAERALRELFAQLKKDRLGQHQDRRRGAGGEPLGETKLYEFGDPFDLDLERTVMNALTRSGSGVPVGLQPMDFEVRRMEDTTCAATVLLVDQSRSMGLLGSFTAAKKVAMALHALTQSHFPRDRFYVVGFSDYAVEMKGQDLPEMTWNAWVSGTNMHHALMLSRRLLAKDKALNRQIIMITDGEPTAHLEGDRSLFSYPPSYRTLEETLKEVNRCTREGITINTFMLESDASLGDFVDRMTRINRGRAFYTTPEKLGEYVLVDYLASRRKRVS